MSGVTVEVVKGNTLDRLKTLIEKRNLFPGWAKRRLKPLLKLYQETRFDGQGVVDSDPNWAPLSPLYAARKAKKYPGKGILEASGELRKAATLEGPNYREVVTDDTAIFSIALTDGTRYFKYNNEGTDRMPARTFLGVTDNFRSKVMADFKSYVQSALVKRGS